MLSKEKRVIIGIDGLSRSGKTTFVNKMRHEVNRIDREILVLHLDDYIVARKERYNTSNEDWYEYYALQWDIHYLRDQLFKKVRVASTLRLQRYDEQSDSHTLEEISIHDAAVIVIEGVFLQRKEWRDYFDYVIYLDCPRRTRFLRESERTQKNLTKFQDRYWKAEDYYLMEQSPMENADVVINSS
ncbi:kinase [Alkalihalobacillus sp. R86527]|uniref:kinase n=1 Tax=Alkalihalobacillus sp. R86527 TaxID=3093863 RepID=UPI00366E2DE1